MPTIRKGTAADLPQIAAIYQALFRKFSLTPANCVFIDDFPPNIEAAENAGMQGIVFYNAQQLRHELQKRGVL